MPNTKVPFSQLKSGGVANRILRDSGSAVEWANYSSRNAIINGDFNIWQRGTSFAAIAASAYSADRWIYAKSGAMVHTISRSTDVPTVAQSGRLFNYSLLVDCTTADAALAASEYASVSQRIEGFNFLPFAQREIVVSFWAKATLTGEHAIRLGNVGGDRSYIGAYTINASNTWEFKTVLCAASPSAGTWDYDTGTGLHVSFILAAGTTFHTAAGAWQTGNFLGTATTVNDCDNVANNFQICGVQLELGNVATTIEPRPLPVEELLCYRYYYEHLTVTTGGPITISQAYGAGSSMGVFWFPVPMRAPPTFSYSGTFKTLRASAGGEDAATPSMGTVERTCALVYAASANLVAGDATRFTGDAGSKLIFSAEL